MPLSYTKIDYVDMTAKRVRAFRQIAEALGKEHPITKMMGGLAWGRHNFEIPVGGGLQDAVRAMSALDGYFAALNLWARDHDQAAQRVMLERYPQAFSSALRPKAGS